MTTLAVATFDDAMIPACIYCGSRGSAPPKVVTVRDETLVKTLAAQCGDCLGVTFVIVEIGKGTPNRATVCPVDLAPEEVAKMLARDPVSADDVLDVHEALENGLLALRCALQSIKI